jgi:hypothetical protein
VVRRRRTEHEHPVGRGRGLRSEADRVGHQVRGATTADGGRTTRTQPLPAMVAAGRANCVIVPGEPLRWWRALGGDREREEPQRLGGDRSVAATRGSNRCEDSTRRASRSPIRRQARTCSRSTMATAQPEELMRVGGDRGDPRLERPGTLVVMHSTAHAQLTHSIKSGIVRRIHRLPLFTCRQNPDLVADTSRSAFARLQESNRRSR